MNEAVEGILTKTQVCSHCGEEKELSEFPYDRRGKKIWYRKKCRECKEETATVKLPDEVKQTFLDIEKKVKKQHITKVVFEAQEHPTDPRYVAILASNTLALMAALLQYQDLMRTVFGNIEATPEGEDSFHSVAGEELDASEKPEAFY